MSRGCWCIFLAAFGWLILSAQTPQPKAEHERAQAAERIGQPAPRRAPVPVEVVNQPSEPSGYHDPCQYNQNDSRSDLCAQWTAANGAQAAAYYAGWQLWAAAAGMVGLLVTIWLTSCAVKAAQASVAVAQDTAKRQLRAYLAVSKVEVRDVQPDCIWGYIHIINQGATPARITQAFERAWIGPATQTDPINEGPPAQDYLHLRDQLSQGLPDKILFQVNDPAEIKKLDGSKTIDFYIYGRIEYQDVFGDPQWLTFAFRNDGWVVSKESSFSPSIHGNDGS